MHHHEQTIEVGEGHVRLNLALPEPADRGAPCAGVMICHGLGCEHDDVAPVIEAFVTRIVGAGCAALTYQPRCAGAILEDFNRYSAADAVDDASAAFRALTLREEVDANRIGVLGYSLGAIPAACLARRIDNLARLCLVAPPTIEALRSGANGQTLLNAEHAPSELVRTIESLTPEADAAFHDRPTLILHGAADRTIAPEKSFSYVAGIRSAGHSVEHMLVALGDHAFTDELARAACVDQLTEFFAEMVRRDSMQPVS